MFLAILSFYCSLVLWTIGIAGGQEINVEPDRRWKALLSAHREHLAKYHNPRNWIHLKTRPYQKPSGRTGLHQTFVESEYEPESDSTELSASLESRNDERQEGRNCYDHDEDSFTCREKGCFYCCSDQMCYNKESDAPDCIKGCSKYCDLQINCHIAYCIYRPGGVCTGIERRSVAVFALCGYANFKTFNNFSVRPVTYRSGSFSCPDNFEKTFKALHPHYQEQSLVRYSAKRGTFWVWIPVEEDGFYNLRFLLAHTGVQQKAANVYIYMDEIEVGHAYSELFISHNTLVNDNVTVLSEWFTMASNGKKISFVDHYSSPSISRAVNINLYRPHLVPIKFKSIPESDEYYVGAILLFKAGSD